MTAIPTYVPLIPLPAPVTSGTTVQTYIDPNGDVWVAKNGVNGGFWRRARDVVSIRVSRTAAYTYPTSGAPMPYNNIDRDVYGLYNTLNANAFTAPVAGLYQIEAMACATFTAASQFLALTGTGFRTNVYSPAAVNTYAHAHFTAYLNAGDALVINASTSVALAAVVTSSDNFFMATYLGTG